MKVEFLILADAAQVADGKLFMLGGGWTMHRSGNYPSAFQFAICLSILVPWNEAGIRYPLTVTIADEAGVPIVPPLTGQFEVGKPADMPKGMTQRTMFAMNLNLAIPHPGKYVVSASAGSSEATTAFDAIFVGKKVEMMPPESGAAPPGETERGN